jgi:Zn-dependent M16 (insulinase) family peptidase
MKAISLGLLGTTVAFASLALSSSAQTAETVGASGPAGPNDASGVINLADLKKGQLVNGFRTEAVYIIDSGKPMGARFKHVRSGFTVDLLSVQTAPQAFIWVNSPPTSDMGEAHTQEHLLLGKGNKGRSVATLEEMSMTSSSAMTMQWRTCYHFNTTAGADVFYEQLQRRLDALLHPDYTDVEVAREVRNFGVSKDPKDGHLKLEEQGTVYNEMVRSVRSSGHNLWRLRDGNTYGKDHPLYYMSGGSPEGLRQLTADDIKAFRKTHYVLHNMGMVVAVPKTMATAEVLSHFNDILSGLQPEPVAAELLDKSETPPFPPPNPVPLPAGKIEIVGYPDKDAEKPGTIFYYWPANLELDTDHELLLGLFLQNLASDPATPLYKKLIDRRTRFMDLGASGVYSSVSDELGFPVGISVSSVAKDKINEKVIADVWEQVAKELTTIASWKDGSPELAAFNARIRDRIIDTKRSYGKFVNSPPGFGNRRSGGGWMNVLRKVGRGGAFYRSVTMKPEITFAEKELSKKTNIWRDYLKDWHLVTIKPYAAATKPDPALLTAEEEATKVRLAEETQRLKKLYNAPDDQAALRAYMADYEKETAALEELAKHDEPAKLVKSLPLTEDDPLDYKVGKLGGVPLVTSTFDSMTGGTAAVALRADSIDEDDLLYLGYLPTMLNSVGVIVNGKPISYEDMLEMLRREVLSVGCSFSTNATTGRCELVMRGSGNEPQEVDKAIIWMERMLKHPDWRTQNLPRIRDVIDQSLNGLRNVRQGSEEGWVHGVSSGVWRQDRPLYLNVSSFLTRVHNVQRLRWLLKGDASPETIKSFVAFMDKLSGIAGEAKREDLKSLLDKLQVKEKGAANEDSKEVQAKNATANSDAAAGKNLAAAAADKDAALSNPAFKAILDDLAAQPKAVAAFVSDAAKDLAQDLADIPDSTLAGDWPALCAEIAADVQVPPAKTLARFEKIRSKLLTTGGARVFLIGAESTTQRMKAPMEALLTGFGETKFTPAKYTSRPFVFEQLLKRDSGATKPVYIGFVNPNSLQGVFLNSAPALKYSDLDQESLLRYLAFLQYSGGGAHSIFMKTWGAGLAYSNGLRCSVNDRMSYYAERTPALPDTIKFVAAQLKEAPANLNLGDYAVAQAFSSMAAQSYESRGESIAESLVDDEPPDVVKRFRLAILDLRSKPDLSALLHERMLAQYGRVVPGLGVHGKDVPDSVYVVIGDEKQMKLYEEYLKAVEGPETHLYRIYGRDFWHFDKR